MKIFELPVITGSLRDRYSNTIMTNNNGTPIVISNKGKVLRMDGVNQYLNTNLTGDSGNELTVFIAVKGSPASGIVAIAHYISTGDERSWYIRVSDLNSSKMRVTISDDGTVSSGHYKNYYSSIDAFDNEWHLIGFIFNNGNLDLYVDGVKDLAVNKQTDSPITTIYQSNDDLFYGASNSGGGVGNFFIGCLGDVNIFNEALTQAKINSLYLEFQRASNYSPPIRGFIENKRYTGKFDGIDDYGEALNTESDFNFSDEDFILQLKTKNPLGSGYKALIAKYNTSLNKRGYFFGLNDGKLSLFTSTTGSSPVGVITDNRIDDDKVKDIFLYRSKGVSSILVNGVQQYLTSNVVASNIYNTNLNLKVGSIDGAFFNDGNMADVKIGTPAKNIDLFIFAGQSNMSGNSGAASEAGDLEGESVHSFTYNIYGSGSDINTNLKQPVNHWGSEISFSSSALVNKKSKIAIVKVSRGGTGFGEGQWIKGGEQYEQLVVKYNEAIAALELEGYTVTVKGMCWSQGENDARSLEWANNYYDAFILFKSNLLSDLNLADLKIAFTRARSDLPTGGVGGRYDFASTVRAKHELLSLLDNMYMIDTDSYSLELDGVHFDGTGLLQMGKDFYDIFKYDLSTIKISGLEYKFNKGSGPTVFDTSENEKDITLYNTSSSSFWEQIVLESSVYLHETFAANGADGVNKLPLGWDAGTGTVAIKEDATSKYMECTGDGTISIELGIANDYANKGYVQSLLYYNGSSWADVGGDTLDQVISDNAWLTYVNNKLVFTLTTGDRIRNITLKQR